MPIAVRWVMRLLSITAAVVACVALFSPRHTASAIAGFDPKTASFAVELQGATSAYRDAAAFVMPGEALTVTAVGGPPGDYQATGDPDPTRVGPRAWRWNAPREPRLYELRVIGPASDDVIALHVFVLVPATEVHDGMLRGYRIGEYPKASSGAASSYAPPRGFVEVTKKDEDTRLSPHFTLQQFVCKQGPPGEYPKFLVVNPRLPLKLEAVLAEVNALGFHADTLHLMSAYRTPYYNHAIGDVPFSMHQWGSAADVYVDPKNRSEMDDLNGDGRIDVEDARFLYDHVEAILARPENRALEGGLGFYPATKAHPPFVHLDVRGTHARWKG